MDNGTPEAQSAVLTEVNTEAVHPDASALLSDIQGAYSSKSPLSTLHPELLSMVFVIYAKDNA